MFFFFCLFLLVVALYCFVPFFESLSFSWLFVWLFYILSTVFLGKTGFCILWRKNKDLAAVSGMDDLRARASFYSFIFFLDNDSRPMCIIVYYASTIFLSKFCMGNPNNRIDYHEPMNHIFEQLGIIYSNEENRENNFASLYIAYCK